MSYKIIVDSCCDLTPDMRACSEFSIVPLTLNVGEYEIIDDDSFNQEDFLKKVAATPECPKSACPSPMAYLAEYEKADAEDLYVITLSAELSGSYNSAMNAKQMYEEDGGKKHIHVFNSISAATGEVCLAIQVKKEAESGKTFEQVVEAVENYKSVMVTYFVLESLETLRKNGRLSRLSALIANTLNIKPIMCGTREGTIEKVEQTRGMKKALKAMVECVAKEAVAQKEKTCVIVHCNCLERAQDVKKMIEELCHFKDVIISDARGVSSMYANDGGIIVSA